LWEPPHLWANIVASHDNVDYLKHKRRLDTPEKESERQVAGQASVRKPVAAAGGHQLVELAEDYPPAAFVSAGRPDVAQLAAVAVQAVVEVRPLSAPAGRGGLSASAHMSRRRGAGR